MLEHAQYTALGVGLDLFIADMAVQLGLVETLDTRLADGLRATVFNRVESLGLFLVDSSYVADGMGKVRT